jgi:predicted nucleic acid-binding Zn ribbon protein
VTEPRPLRDSLDGVLRSLRPEPSSVHAPRVADVDARQLGGLFARWDEAVGPAVAAHVQPVRLEGTVLSVEVDDPAWATQIRLLEAQVRERLAEVIEVHVDRLDVRVRRRR